MRKIILITFLALGWVITSAQSVNIPDFNFKQALIDEGVDSNGDGEIQSSEAEIIRYLDVSNRNIVDLSGIEAFIGLDTLLSSNNMIEKLELNSNSELKLLDLSNNPLEELDISSLRLIEKIFLESVLINNLILSEHPSLSTLHFTTNESLISDTLILRDLPLLETIFTSQDIFKLELSNLPALTSFENTFTFELLDIHNCQNLRRLNVRGRNNSSFPLSIRIYDLPQLKNLTIFSDYTAGIDFSGFHSLDSLRINGGNLSDDILINGLDSLEFVSISVNEIGAIHLEDLSSLSKFLFSFRYTIQTFSLINLPRLNVISNFSEVNRVREMNLIDLPNFRFNSPDAIPEGLRKVRFSGLPLVDHIIFEDFAGNNSGQGVFWFVLKDMPALDHLEMDRFNGNILDLRDLTNLNELNLILDRPTSFDDGQQVYLRNGNVIENLDLSFYNARFRELDWDCTICADYLEFTQINGYYKWDGIEFTGNCSPGLDSEYYKMGGSTILDINDSGCDENDPILTNVRFIQVDQYHESIFFSDFEGDYETFMADGNTSLKVNSEIDYYTLDSNIVSVNLPVDVNMLNRDFCFKTTGDYNDLMIKIVPTRSRPGLESIFKVIYKNVGTTVLSGTLEFRYTDLYVDYLSSQPIGMDEMGKVEWEFENILPQEERKITVRLRFNSPMDDPPLNAGDALGFGAIIFPIDEDAKPSDNIHNIKLILVDSHDPNDKTCLQGKEITPEMVGEYVDYLIRFENTGTAEAINVVVRDRIDTNVFEINTLTIIDASHKMQTRIIEGNLVEFIFEEIYLPFDDANNDGYVSFSIKTKDDLVLGDKLENTAEIYFDFNWPIITNTATTEVREPVFVREIDENLEINISPNPTSEKITIESSSLFKTVIVLDDLGRIQGQYDYTSPVYSADISLDDPKSGTIYIRIKTIDNQEITRKIIKQ